MESGAASPLKPEIRMARHRQHSAWNAPLLLLGVSLLILFSAQVGLARSLEQVKETKILKVGVEPGFLPFEMKLPNGTWVGFDIDMMEAFSREIGVTVQFIDTKWDGIIPALMAKKFDLIVSGMTITEERKKAVAFSDPYYETGLQALIGIEQKEKLKTLADLDEPSRKIAVKLGTTGDLFASSSIKKARLMKLESEADAANSVRLGKADAFIYDKPFLQLFAGVNKDKVLILPGLLSTEQFGVASRKKDQSLIAAFNNFLSQWKKSGGYEKALKTHFEEMPWTSQLKQLW